MKKRIISLVLLLIPLLANAYDAEVDGIYYNLTKETHEAEVTANPNKYHGTIIIPETVSYEGVEYNVTSIGAWSFNSGDYYLDVTIGDNVKTVGENAFRSCRNLYKLTIGKSVASFGNKCFYNCYPETVIIKDLAKWCYVVYDHGNGDNPISYANHVYVNDEELVNLVIPEGVTMINDFAFYGCKGITNVTIPNSVETIGKYAFAFCDNIKSALIGKGVKRIEYAAFQYCSKLEQLSLPQNLEIIDDLAFWNCSSLTSVTIGNKIKSIGPGAFGKCQKLLDFYCYANNVPNTNGNPFSGESPLENATLHVPAESVNAYKTTEPWSNFGSIIGIIIQSTYRVEHYQLNIDGSIPESPTETESKTGQSGEQTEAIAKTYEGFTPGAVVQTTILSDGSTVVKIYYTRNTFSITFDSDGGSEVQAINLVYGASVKAPTDPVRTGYTFVEWTPALPETMPAENLTFKARWTINKYKLTYTVDGSTYKSYDVEYNSTITPEKELSKEGYTFSGWSWIPSKMPAENVTVTGSFTVNKYTLTYKVDGNVYKTENIDYGATITPEKEPSKEGYTFSGWSWIPSKMPAENVTVTGSFTVNKYKVTYVIGTEEFRVDMVEYGTKIVPPDAPERNGYTFAWADVPNVMPAHDITITGTYTSGIVNHEVEDNNNKTYNLRGVQTPKLVKGINIVRYKNGKTVKVIKK